MNAPLMQRCGHCGQDWWGNHYCPSLNAAMPPFGNTPLRMLTEEDVRRIVREELAAEKEENRRKLRAFIAEVHGADPDPSPAKEVKP